MEGGRKEDGGASWGQLGFVDAGFPKYGYVPSQNNTQRTQQHYYGCCYLSSIGGGGWRCEPLLRALALALLARTGTPAARLTPK